MKYYKKRLKLKKWIKTILVIALLQITTIAILNYAANRFAEIESGKIIVVSENEMSERN